VSFLVLVRRGILKGHFGVIAGPLTTESISTGPRARQVTHGLSCVTTNRTAPCSHRRGKAHGVHCTEGAIKRGYRGTRAPHGAHGAVLPDKEHQRGKAHGLHCTGFAHSTPLSNTHIFTTPLLCTSMVEAHRKRGKCRCVE